MSVAKLYNLARMTVSSTGTGTITLALAATGFLSFAGAGVSDGETVTYAIEDGSNREIGRGVYTASGTTLTRSVLKSTNSNTAISLTSSAQVFITPAADDISLLVGYSTTATAAGTTTLTATSNWQQFFTGATTQTVALPVASTLVLGQPYRIVNNSTGAVTVNSSGGNLVISLPAGAAALVSCILTSGTSAASWNAILIPASIARTNAVQTWTAVQNYAPATLTFNATQTWDVSTNPIAQLALTANITSFSVSGVVAGAMYVLKVTQDTSARTIAYTAANFKFLGSSAPTVSAGSGAIDYYVFIGLSSTVLHEIGRAQNIG